MNNHPSKEQLELYLNDAIQDLDLRENVKVHVEACSFCRVYCDEYMRFVLNLKEIQLPEKVMALAEHLAPPANIISLTPLTVDLPDSENVLAADSTYEDRDSKLTITLYAEETDIVLRIMPGDEGKARLQIIADDPAQKAYVLIHIVEPNLEFMADKDGCVMAKGLPNNDLSSLTWRLILPEAVFTLSPLSFDPDEPQSCCETTLKTTTGDAIQVSFERLTDGNRVTIKLLSLDGITDYEERRMVVTLTDRMIVQPVQAGKPYIIDGVGPENILNIRIY